MYIQIVKRVYTKRKECIYIKIVLYIQNNKNGWHPLGCHPFSCYITPYFTVVYERFVK